MKKIIAFISIVLLAIFGLVSCGTNSPKLSKENIDRIHFTISFGSCSQFLLDQNLNVEQLISQYLLPIRTNRNDQRRLIKKKFPGFLYRIA